MGWDGLGTAIDWIFKRLPSKEESRRAKLEKLEREERALLRKLNKTEKDFSRLSDIADEFGKLYRQAARK